MKKITVLLCLLTVVCIVLSGDTLRCADNSFIKNGPSGQSGDSRSYFEYNNHKYLVQDGALHEFHLRRKNKAVTRAAELVPLAELVFAAPVDDQSQERAVFLRAIAAGLRRTKSFGRIDNAGLSIEMRARCENMKNLLDGIDQLLNKSGQEDAAGMPQPAVDPVVPVAQVAPPASGQPQKPVAVPSGKKPVFAGACMLGTGTSAPLPVAEASPQASHPSAGGSRFLGLATAGVLTVAAALATDVLVRKERSLLVRGVTKGKAIATKFWRWLTRQKDAVQPTRTEGCDIARVLLQEYGV